jgi:hypothetical protein
MTVPKFIEIDGKPHLWRDIVKLRQEQLRAAAEAAPVQRPLFEMREVFALQPNAPQHPVISSHRFFPEPEESRAGRFSLVFPSRISANRS